MAIKREKKNGPQAKKKGGPFSNSYKSLLSICWLNPCKYGVCVCVCIYNYTPDVISVTYVGLWTRAIFLNENGIVKAKFFVWKVEYLKGMKSSIRLKWPYLVGVWLSLSVCSWPVASYVVDSSRPRLSLYSPIRPSVRKEKLDVNGISDDRRSPTEQHTRPKTSHTHNQLGSQICQRREKENSKRICSTGFYLFVSLSLFIFCFFWSSFVLKIK